MLDIDALFVSPLFDLTTFFAFADDKQVMEHNKEIGILIINMERRLELMMKWLRQSGLVVNEEKTELCLFYKRDHPVINVTINNKLVRSKKTINVLGVTFDSKLQWGEHIAQAINKSKKYLPTIRLISKYLQKNEIKQLITSNFYSQLYYNCEIWLMPSLSPVLKQQVLAASSRALRLLNNTSGLRTSYEQLHKLKGRKKKKRRGAP